MSEAQLISGVPNVSKSEAYVELYSNQSRLALTPFDIVLVFGKISETGGQLTVKEDALIRMSPQACKILSENLNTLIASWENQFGNIDLTKLTRPGDELAKSLTKMLAQAAEAPRHSGAEKKPK